jgi:hypothetical protein
MNFVYKKKSLTRTFDRMFYSIKYSQRMAIVHLFLLAKQVAFIHLTATWIHLLRLLIEESFFSFAHLQAWTMV